MRLLHLTILALFPSPAGTSLWAQAVVYHLDDGALIAYPVQPPNEVAALFCYLPAGKSERIFCYLCGRDKAVVRVTLDRATLRRATLAQIFPIGWALNCGGAPCNCRALSPGFATAYVWWHCRTPAPFGRDGTMGVAGMLLGLCLHYATTDRLRYPGASAYYSMQEAARWRGSPSPPPLFLPGFGLSRLSSCLLPRRATSLSSACWDLWRPSMFWLFYTLSPSPYILAVLRVLRGVGELLHHTDHAGKRTRVRWKRVRRVRFGDHREHVPHHR